MRELISRIVCSGTCFHGLSRPSAAISALQSVRISSSISAGFETVRATSSRTTAGQIIRWLEPITVLCTFQIEEKEPTVAASLESMGPLCLDRNVVLKAGQQERSEFAFWSINLA
jgi:hypothetical protein